MSQTFTIIPSAINFAPGQYPGAPIPDFAVPAGTTDIQIRIDTPAGTNALRDLDPSVSVAAGTEISYDGGGSWQPGPSALANGGPRFKKDGITPEDHIGVIGGIPQPANNNRRIRGQMIVTGATVRLGPAIVTALP